MANTQNRQERQLEQILLLPGNNVCADCKAPSPRWASINLSIFLCITCASIHRSLGTHTSRIKSLSLDTWTREMVDAMRKGGNIKGNEEWWPVDVRERFPVPLSTTGEQGGREGEMERFIRRKYEEGAFRADRVQRRERQEEETIRKPVPRSGRDVYGYTTGNSFPISATGGYNDTSRSSPDNNNNNTDFYRSSNRPQSVAGPSSFISSAGKKTSSKTARAHVDANWADFLDVAAAAAADPTPTSTSTSTSLSSTAGRANQAGRGKKAGRLLGMPFIGSDDDRAFAGDVDAAANDRVYGGAVRLPPVTKAPKGLAYKSDSKPPRSPPPPVPSKKEHLARLAKTIVADEDRNRDGNGKVAATPTPTPALIDIAQAQPHPMQTPPVGPAGNMHTTLPSAQTMMPAQQTSQMMMMTNPYNPFMQVQPQYQQQQQQQQQFQQQQHQFQPQFPNQPTYHHHPQQQISFGGQSMQPIMGMGIGMMSQGNGTMYSQQYQPPNIHQQQPHLYAAAAQQMGGNPAGGYYNPHGQAQGMNAYGQAQMGQQSQQQMGQGQMMGQMGQMQQGQGMMGWQ